MKRGMFKIMNIKCSSAKASSSVQDSDDSLDPTYSPKSDCIDSDGTEERVEFRQEWLVGLGREEWIIPTDASQVMFEYFISG
jgi:hypothetical protein